MALSANFSIDIPPLVLSALSRGCCACPSWPKFRSSDSSSFFSSDTSSSSFSSMWSVDTASSSCIGSCNNCPPQSNLRELKEEDWFSFSDTAPSTWIFCCWERLNRVNCEKTKSFRENIETSCVFCCGRILNFESLSSAIHCSPLACCRLLFTCFILCCFCIRFTRCSLVISSVNTELAVLMVASSQCFCILFCCIVFWRVCQLSKLLYLVGIIRGGSLRLWIVAWFCCWLLIVLLALLAFGAGGSICCFWVERVGSCFLVLLFLGVAGDSSIDSPKGMEGSGSRGCLMFELCWLPLVVVVWASAAADTSVALPKEKFCLRWFLCWIISLALETLGLAFLGFSPCICWTALGDDGGVTFSLSAPCGDGQSTTLTVSLLALPPDTFWKLDHDTAVPPSPKPNPNESTSLPPWLLLLPNGSFQISSSNIESPTESLLDNENGSHVSSSGMLIVSIFILQMI